MAVAVEVEGRVRELTEGDDGRQDGVGVEGGVEEEDVGTGDGDGLRVEGE